MCNTCSGWHSVVGRELALCAGGASVPRHRFCLWVVFRRSNSGPQTALGPAHPKWVPVNGKIRWFDHSTDQTISLNLYQYLTLGPSWHMKGLKKNNNNSLVKLYYSLLFTLLLLHRRPFLFGGGGGKKRQYVKVWYATFRLQLPLLN